MTIKRFRAVPLGPLIAIVFMGVTACSPETDDAGAGISASSRLVPDLSIGVLEGPETETFGRISGLLGDDQGRIYVLDSQASSIRVFSSSGDFQFSIGQPGEGPGELDGPCCMAWSPDGLLWLRDGGNGRYSAFQVTGTEAGFVMVKRFAHGDDNLWTETTFSETGNLIDVGTLSVGSPPTSKRYRLTIGDAGEVISEEVIEPPADEEIGRLAVTREFPGGGQARLYFYTPFGPRHEIAHGPGGVWAEVVSSEYVVEVHRPEGSLEIRGPTVSGPALSPGERASAAERIASDTRRSGRNSLGIEIPDSKPPIRDLYFDDVGRLWVELSVEEGADRRADVYDRDGTLLVSATWPGDIDHSSPAWPGNGRWSLGIQTDSLGVQRVVRMVHEAG